MKKLPSGIFNLRKINTNAIKVIIADDHAISRPPTSNGTQNRKFVNRNTLPPNITAQQTSRNSTEAL